MKMDRRSFLSFLIGGAAGTTLSPLPWKLTDDLAIWSQNWPWTPVPESGEVTFVETTCMLCPGGCGVTVRKVGDHAVKIEGTPGHPVNDGGICILGLSGLQLLYGPTRVPSPLRRTGGRGENRWEKISWEDAIVLVVEKLTALRDERLPHTLACISGTDGGTVGRLMERFLTAYGSPNFIRTPSMRDSYEMTLHLMQGVQASAGFDVENADFILSFGSGILEGWGSPVRMFRAHSAWKEKGSKVVQIEPRLSNTAAKSDKWLPVNPGTEGILALGLAHVILKESLHRREFIGFYASGLDRWKNEVLSKWTPEQVEAVTGIDKSTTVALARSFSGANHPLAICGRGKGTTPGSIGEFMAVHGLNALVGNINRKGGIWAVPGPDYIQWPEVEMDATAAAGMQQPRIDGAGTQKYIFARHLLHRVPEMVTAADPSRVQALFVLEANPYYTLSDPALLKKALDKIPFIVSFSSFMDETAQNADLILPNHMYLERYEDVPCAEGFNKPYIGWAKPVVHPQFHTMHTGDVILRLAKALGDPVQKAFPWEDYEGCLDDTLGDALETLRETGYRVEADFAPGSGYPAFETASGRFEFISEESRDAGMQVMVQPQGEAPAFPLILIPFDSQRLANGYIGDPPFVIKTVPDTVLKGDTLFVEVHPETAKTMGLSEGKSALLATPKGEARVRVHLFEGIMPGLVGIPTGLGHHAYDGYLAGKGVNASALMGPVEDGASGLNAAWGIRAKLSRV